MLIDTHCHIHEAAYPDPEGAYQRALGEGVRSMICVGTSIESSRQAVEFAKNHENAFAALGVHPHETHEDVHLLEPLLDSRVVAVGEIGLDYFYSHSPRDVQLRALEYQLQFARDHSLPVIFHVREAFEDFWPVFRNFTGIKGVLHSFTDTEGTLNRALSEGLYIGVNGISTFTKDPSQKEMFDHIPLEKIVLETDAPFLTPIPFRGKVNEPAYVRLVAAFHADRRGISVESFEQQTTDNARALFSI